MLTDPAASGQRTQHPLSPHLPYLGVYDYFNVSGQGGRHGQLLPTVQPGGLGILLGSFVLGQHALLGTKLKHLDNMA